MFSGVVTSAGTTLLGRWASESKLIITRAACGTGTSENLAGQTSVASEAHDISITSKKAVSNGVKYGLRIYPAGSSLTVKQIGIYAKIEGDSNETLLAVFQDSTGKTIPASGDMPDYAYSCYAFVEMSNEGDMDVTIDSGAYVVFEDIEPVLLWHNPNPTSALGYTELSIPSNEYDFYIVEYVKTASDYASDATELKKVRRKADFNIYYVVVAGDGSEVYTHYRNIDFSASTPNISQCYYCRAKNGGTMSGDGHNPDNSYLIPVAIYGTNVMA